MAGHSVPVDFWVEPQKITNPVERETLLQDFVPIVEPFSGSLKRVLTGDIPGRHHMVVYASDNMTLSVKLYSNGLVSSTLEYLVSESNVNDHKILIDDHAKTLRCEEVKLLLVKYLLNLCVVHEGWSKDGRTIEKQLMEKFQCRRARVLPALKRAPPMNPYFSSSDDRILEYDVDKILFEEQSDFQKVLIIHTKSFGNMLLLDELQNLAESDLSYTQGLMNLPTEKFKGKEILILGGGDGALLYELLKEDPAFVTMIEIDEVVIKSCREHLRSVCGNCMDSYEGTNYKIIIGDAIAYMKDYITEGRKFDYVFGDLTDVPISKTPRGPHWDFMRTIMSLGIEILKPGTGKYMTHAIGIQCESALEMFEEQIKKLPLPVSFTRTSAMVPSFMENWCFYQITLKGV